MFNRYFLRGSILVVMLFVFIAVQPGVEASAAENDFSLVLQNKGTIKSLHLSPKVEQDGLAFAVLEEEQRSNNHVLYRSKDAGLTWEPLLIKIDGVLELDHNNLIYDLEIGEHGNVYMTGLFREAKPTLYVSRDFGSSWDTVTKDGPQAIELLDEKKMIGVFRNISGLSSMLKLSKDAGYTWNYDIGLNIAAGNGALLALDAQTFLALKTDEMLWLTRDGGKTWNKTEVKIPKYLSLGHSGKIAGRLDQTGNVTAAVCGPGKSPYLYVTEDSKFHWKTIKLAEQQLDPSTSLPYVNTVAMMPKGHIFAGTNDKKILVSPDYGETWKILSRGFQGEIKHLECAYFKDMSKTLILAASEMVLYRMEYGKNGEQETDKEASTDAPTIKFFVDQKNYQIDEENLLMDAQPFIAGDHVYVPLRYLALALGVSEDRIFWYPISQTVIMTKNEIRLDLFVGDDVIYVNDLPTCMYTKSLIVKDRVYLPARYVAEAFGYQVNWEPATRSVTIRPQ